MFLGINNKVFEQRLFCQQVCTIPGTNLCTEPSRFDSFVLSKHIPRPRLTDCEKLSMIMNGYKTGYVTDNDDNVIQHFQVVWFYNRTTRLSTSDRLSLEERKGGGETLTLSNLTHNDFGLYTCRSEFCKVSSDVWDCATAGLQWTMTMDVSLDLI